jgi:hypothetical protein
VLVADTTSFIQNLDSIRSDSLNWNIFMTEINISACRIRKIISNYYRVTPMGTHTAFEILIRGCPESLK